jgi:ABC-type transport system substrate-binding protein
LLPAQPFAVDPIWPDEKYSRLRRWVPPAALVRQNEVRSTFPGITTPGAAGGTQRRNLEYFSSGQIGSTANGWAGSNRGGWSNPEYDQFWATFNVTLDRAERTRRAAEMMKLISEELPGWPLYWDFNVMAYSSVLRGPELGIPNVSTLLWNVHEWQMG